MGPRASGRSELCSLVADRLEDDGLTTRGPRFINASNKWANPFSFHPGGVHVAPADVSVRFLSENMSNLVFIALCTEAGGEVVGEF